MKLATLDIDFRKVIASADSKMSEKKKVTMVDHRSIWIEYSVAIKVYKETKFQASKSRGDWSSLFEEKSRNSMVDSKLFKPPVSLVPEEGSEWRTILSLSTAKKQPSQITSHYSQANPVQTPLKSDSNHFPKATLTPSKAPSPIPRLSTDNLPVIATQADREKNYHVAAIIDSQTIVNDISDHVDDRCKDEVLSGGERREKSQQSKVNEMEGEKGLLTVEELSDEKRGESASKEVQEENTSRKLIFENSELKKKLITEPKTSSKKLSPLRTPRPPSPSHSQKSRILCSVSTQTDPLPRPLLSDSSTFTENLNSLQIELFRGLFFSQKQEKSAKKIEIDVLPCLEVDLSRLKSQDGYGEAIQSEFVEPNFGCLHEIRNSPRNSIVIQHSLNTQRDLPKESYVWNAFPSNNQGGVLESEFVRGETPESLQSPSKSPLVHQNLNHSAVKVVDLDSFNLKNSTIANRLNSLDSPENERNFDQRLNHTGQNEYKNPSHGTFSITPETQLEDLVLKLRESKQELHSQTTLISQLQSDLELSHQTIKTLQIEISSLILYQHKTDARLYTLTEELDRVTEEYMFTKQDLSVIFNAVIEDGSRQLIAKIEYLINKRSFLNK